MEYTFLYEEALAETGIKQADLPEAVQGQIKDIVSKCRVLADLPDDQTEEAEKLNTEIDNIDEAVANKINELKSTPATPPKTPPTPPAEAPNEEAPDNTGKVVLGLAIVGGLIWGAMKIFGGKK